MFWGHHEEKEITPSRKFSCSICNKSIEVSLPVYPYRVDFTKCDSKDVTLHNLEYVIRCQNCGQTATIYYCGDSHVFKHHNVVCVEKKKEIAFAISSRTTKSARALSVNCTVMQP